jgi:hypothetical protein
LDLDYSEVIGVEIIGFSQNIFNGKWIKRVFSNDGHPVYSTTNYEGQVR